MGQSANRSDSPRFRFFPRTPELQLDNPDLNDQIYDLIERADLDPEQEARARLDALLVLGWRQKIQSRARIRLAIEDALDQGLPKPCTETLYHSKCDVVFEHVYESYAGENQSVYNNWSPQP